jgi:hypothetical protein
MKVRFMKRECKRASECKERMIVDRLKLILARHGVLLNFINIDEEGSILYLSSYTDIKYNSNESCKHIGHD